MEILAVDTPRQTALNGVAKDRERERVEDLVTFRAFATGLAEAQSENVTLRAQGTRAAREAFTKIYLRYRERVYAYSLRVLGNAEDAEDIFQEVFFRVYSRAQSFEEERSVGGWIFTIAHNLCMNKIRDRKPQEAIEDANLSVDPSAEMGEDWQTVIAEAIEALPIEYREVIVLREYQGMSYAEMTEILQTTVPAIKSRLYRAKGRLRELLAPYYLPQS
ncbi:MAG TPA: sigma-70 family RNA polymerase sigma factor [Candidatus Kapabacteria bacterium]|jgi:RNA polymerase sigma-70 factor (ECF subfamily)